MTPSSNLAVGALGVLTVVAALSACRDTRWINAFEALPPPGTPAPQFEAPLVHADTLVSGKSLLGAPSVVALWSTTCRGSRESLARLRELNETYKMRGVRFLILAADPSISRLSTFVDSAHVEIPMAHAPDLEAFDFSDQASDTDEYRVLFALPSFLVLDSRGVVVARSGGMLSDSVLVSALDSLTRGEGAS